MSAAARARMKWLSTELLFAWVSGRGLARLLGVCMVILVGQLGWPSFHRYINQPERGHFGQIDNPVAEKAPSIADKCLVYLPEDYGLTLRRHPLLLYLHGSGQRGDDIALLEGHSLPATVIRGRKLSFVILMPQCREGAIWTSSDLEMLLKAFEQSYRIDFRRLFVVGYSMGGFGAWQLALRMPNRVAGVASLAGAPPPYRLDALAHTPIWAFHGDRDDVVPVDVSQNAVDGATA
jgi:poly(3-hydroxybutyrate) depolymerase